MASTKKQTQTAKRYVVVVARPNGSSWARVVAGTLVESGNGRVVLTDARQALYYGRESNGEVGLATNGPRGDSRITAPAPRVELDGVGFLADCTEAARAAWQSAPALQ